MSVIIHSVYDPPPSYSLERYAPVRLLWIKVILRAASDWALYKDAKDLKLKKWATDAERWLFYPSTLMNGLESICNVLELDVDKVRSFARQLTRDQVKKMDYLERQGRDSSTALMSAMDADGND